MDYKTHVMRAINYIENNLKNEIMLADCARVSGYSDYHFIRVFKEATGLTPADYIRKRRLTDIKHMRQDVPVSRRLEYGFNSKETLPGRLSQSIISCRPIQSALNSLNL